AARADRVASPPRDRRGPGRDGGAGRVERRALRRDDRGREGRGRDDRGREDREVRTASAACCNRPPRPGLEPQVMGTTTRAEGGTQRIPGRPPMAKTAKADQSHVREEQGHE